jgi:hypothetical protein
MERLNCDVCSAQLPLQEAPEIFDSLSVYLAPHIFVNVVYRLVNELLCGNAIIGDIIIGVEGRLSARKDPNHEITRDLYPRNAKFPATIYPCFGKLLGAPLNDSRSIKRPFGAFCETLSDHLAGSRSHNAEHFVRVAPLWPRPRKSEVPTEL